MSTVSIAKSLVVSLGFFFVSSLSYGESAGEPGYKEAAYNEPYRESATRVYAENKDVAPAPTELITKPIGNYTAQDEAARLKYIAQIELNTAEELNQTLERVADLVEKGDWQRGRDEPVAFLLHGNEANALMSSNYQQNQKLVELAKSLSDKQAVSIRICRVWMLNNGIENDQLPAFVSPIYYAPLGKKMLELEGFVYF